ncbi:MAG: putative Zn-dependent peptidase [Chloroflexi bacterium AL-W]|nr:putative Zn-dependent peptidase [Chloroflexi bacterium AL-N1]NOK67915.1 putative Zn-dependent peptidase [Chloroflexi bacterium AL-N10]NOK73255.1 putative Zn-dependent peptidase [Chloroflexi bacterium AL-N5]NOK83169.1 putative Zn-dependent peptidase [Chloroflexi bacterium AL-W]NOK87586.1 putative Zn-dependent peptidase [Chloroflexi bacterium AL-N15]
MTTTTHTLPNGLSVIIREVHSAPVATCWVWYRVGSRNELPGVTGISHWVEHMLFKGTPSIPKGQMDRLIARNGGTFNGFTSYDYTAYFETLPSDRIELGLQIESDRMINSVFDPDEVDSERTVIISEREGHENDPEWWLSEAVMTAAFQFHPYRNEIIGWKSDLRAMTREDLFQHYQTYYMPNNAVLVVVGDVDTQAIMEKVEHYFAGLPTGPELPLFRAEEPEQQGERRVVVQRPGAAHYVQMVYHAPDCRHADYPAMVALDAILSGGKAMSFSGAQTNRSSRIYRALVETQLASYASSSFRATYDPYLIGFDATVSSEHTPETVEKAFLQEIEKIQQDGVSDAEVAKAIKQARAQIAYSGDSVTNQALLLGMWEVLDSHQRVETLLDELQTVTAADVQRVTQSYLSDRNRTVGYFIPTDDGSGNGLEGNFAYNRATSPSLFRRKPRHVFFSMGLEGWDTTDTHAIPTRGFATPTASTGGTSIEQTIRHVLPNGVTALIYRNTSSQTVSVRGDVRVGAIHETSDKNGLSVFTGASLIRGTTERTFQEIVSETEERGASVNASGGVHVSGFAGRSLAEDVPLVLETLASMLHSPTFPAEEIERLRMQFLMSLRESEQETRTQSSRAVRALLYPAEHPYSRVSSGTMETIQGITREDLMAFHQLYHPAATRIAIVGNVEPDTVIEELERTFGMWAASGEPPAMILPDVPTLQGVQRRDIAMAGKIQSDVIWAVHGLKRDSPDYYVASVANMILGRLGLGGRLGDNVREQQGLAYYCGSSVEADVGAGPWAALAGVNPANVERAIEAILHEVKQFGVEGPTVEEMDDAQSYMIGSLVLGLETNDGIAGTLLAIERFDLGLDFIARYPDIIRSITAEQVVAVVRKYLSTENYTLAVAGPEVA